MAAYLREVYPTRLPLVFGVMRDKNAWGMLQALLPCATHLVLTEPNNPRAADASDLARQARQLAPALSVEVERDPRAALRPDNSLFPR